MANDSPRGPCECDLNFDLGRLACSGLFDFFSVFAQDLKLTRAMADNSSSSGCTPTGVASSCSSVDGAARSGESTSHRLKYT